MSIEEISSIIMRSFTKAHWPHWNGKENLQEAIRQKETCKKLNIGFLKVTDSDYPVMLKTISNPPYMLFYRGSLEGFSQKSVSVVGTRNLSPEGKTSAFDFAKKASQAGVCVISGLAKGADGFAHKGAVDAWFETPENDSLGRTIAVLPGPIDEIRPQLHVKLAENIIKSGGCLVSEYPPLSEFGNWQYVQRNRIIAALSPATVVIEAPNGSGSLITVDFALELSRDVMFHKSCFNDYAKKINEGVIKNLENQYNNKKISRHKFEVCVDQYVKDGAPVIEDFEDYCKCFSEIPGSRSSVNTYTTNTNINRIEQLSLFD